MANLSFPNSAALIRTELERKNANNQELHSILGIEINATAAQIRKAYIKKAKLFHPNAANVIAAIAADPSKKEYYDHEFDKICQTYHALMEKMSNDNTSSSKSCDLTAEIKNPFVTFNEPSKNIDIIFTKKLGDYKGLDIDLSIDKDPAKDLLPYSDNFSHFDFETLKEELHKAERHYQFLQNEKSPEYICNQKAFLWKAEKKGHPDIYIFNSIHRAEFDAENIFGDALNNVLDKVAVVYTEAQGIKSTATHSYLGLDEMIARKAAKMGKSLKALEDEKVYQHITQKRLDAIPTPLASIDNIEQDIQLQYLTNISYSTSMMSEETQTELQKRNSFWMINSILTEKNACLVVAGSLHSSGKWGLPNLLAVEGYTLTPQILKAPNSRSEMVYRVFYHDRGLDQNKSQSVVLYSLKK